MSNSRTRPGRFRGLLVPVGLVLLAEGCLPQPATRPTPAPIPVGRVIRTVQVERVDTLPTQGTLQVGGPVGRGKETGKGAAKGAGTGAAGGAWGGFEASLRSGPLAPFLMPIFVVGGAVGGAVVGGAVGGVTGYVNSIPEQQVKDMEAVLTRNQIDLSTELLRRVRERVPLVGKVLAEPGAAADLRLEVTIPSWYLNSRPGSNPSTTFVALVSYRLSEPDGTVFRDRTFPVGGATRLLAEWRAEDGAPLRQAIQSSLQTAAEAVADSVFLIQDFNTGRSAGTPSFCGLAHCNPSSTARAWLVPSSMLLLTKKWDQLQRPIPKVDSLLPSLQWEAFPRQADRDKDGGQSPSPITDVQYDLRIWTSVGGGPGDLVYERLNLKLEPQVVPAPVLEDAEEGAPVPAPGVFVEHRLGVPLAPNTEYLWSVRARFRLDGEARATRWSALDPPPNSMDQCSYDGIPPDRYHRFRTP